MSPKYVCFNGEAWNYFNYYFLLPGGGGFNIFIQGRRNVEPLFIIDIISGGKYNHIGYHKFEKDIQALVHCL